MAPVLSLLAQAYGIELGPLQQVHLAAALLDPFAHSHAAELVVRALVGRGGHDGVGLSLAEDRAGVNGLAGALLDGQRLAGQGGLVHAEIVAIEELGIGGDDVS